VNEQELTLAGAGFDRLMDVEEDEPTAKLEEPEPVEGDSALPPAAAYPGL
jgi:hypothetical protein